MPHPHHGWDDLIPPPNLTPPQAGVPPPSEAGQGPCSLSSRWQKAGGLLRWGHLTTQRPCHAGKHQHRGRDHAAVPSRTQGDHLATRMELSAPKPSGMSGRFGLLKLLHPICQSLPCPQQDPHQLETPWTTAEQEQPPQHPCGARGTKQALPTHPSTQHGDGWS